MRPSPAMVIALIALFIALGGTSYAAITSLPAHSVGTLQLKNGAVGTAKLKLSVLKNYFHTGGTLPSGKTGTGVWGYSNNSQRGGGSGRAYVAYPIPLSAGLDGSHTIYVSGASATHCSGAGYADPGYLCVCQGYDSTANTPTDSNIFNPETGPRGRASAAGRFT